MALDLEAIRRKVNQLNGVKGANSQGSVKRWKPAPGEHVIRVLPWKDAPEGSPFKERWIYYGIGKSWITSPKSFGQHDPIDEFIKKLYDRARESTPEVAEENKAIAKKLWPKLSTCAAIIDRAAEDQGPQLWVMGKREAADVLGFFLDSDYGDITGLKEGFDLKVKVTPSPKKFNGKTVYDTKIECKPRPSPASADAAKTAKWMDSLPNVDEYYKPMTSDAVKSQFDAWVNAGGPESLLRGDTQQANEGSEGADRGKPEAADAVDALAKELNTKPAEEKAAPKTEAKKADKPAKAAAKKDGKEFNNIDDALDDALGDLDDLVD